VWFSWSFLLHKQSGLTEFAPRMSPWEYLLQPAILFFLLGVVAALVKSDLEIPGSVLKILSLYLLFVAYTFIHKLW
jgi:hypothetical protein